MAAGPAAPAQPLAQKQSDNRHEDDVKSGNEPAFAGRGKNHADLLQAGAAEQHDTDQQPFFQKFQGEKRRPRAGLSAVAVVAIQDQRESARSLPSMKRMPLKVKGPT